MRGQIRLLLNSSSLKKSKLLYVLSRIRYYSRHLLECCNQRYLPDDCREDDDTLGKNRNHKAGADTCPPEREAKAEWRQGKGTGTRASAGSRDGEDDAEAELEGVGGADRQEEEEEGGGEEDAGECVEDVDGFGEKEGEELRERKKRGRIGRVHVAETNVFAAQLAAILLARHTQPGSETILKTVN